MPRTTPRHTHYAPDRSNGGGHLIETWRIGNRAFRAVVEYDASYDFQSYATMSTWGVGGWNELVRLTGNEVNLYVKSDEGEGLQGVVDEMTSEAIDLLDWPEPTMPR